MGTARVARAFAHPTAAPPDPIFAAIVEHREAAAAAFEAACHRLSDLEGEIPKAWRKEYRNDQIGTEALRGSTAVGGLAPQGDGANDDARWKAAMAAFRATDGAEPRAAWALAHVAPATLRGAAAVMRYAHDFAVAGCEWPVEAEEDGGREDWHCAFHRSMAAALGALA